MKRWIIGVAVVVALAILFWRPATSPTVGALPSPKGSAPSDRSIRSGSPAPVPASPPTASTTPPPPEGASRRPVIPRPDPPESEAKVALEAVALNLRNFGQRFGGNPVGSNAEITKSLNGGNPAHARYVPEQASIDAQGELTDHWGTPYFFHQQSAYETVIRSAGPDRKLYTVDDLTAK